MIEVGDFAGNVVTAFLVVLPQFVGFSPEVVFVYSVAAKEGSLHVGRNQRLIEIPDTGDDVLSKESRCHGKLVAEGVEIERSVALSTMVERICFAMSKIPWFDLPFGRQTVLINRF